MFRNKSSSNLQIPTIEESYTKVNNGEQNDDFSDPAKTSQQQELTEDIATKNSNVHPLQSLKDSVVNFCKNGLLLECLVCLGVWAVGQVIPLALERYSDWNNNTGPVPYQVNHDGDVLLDPSLAYPYIESTVPGWLLHIICNLLGLLTLLAVASTFGPKGDLHAALCVYLVANGMNALLCNSLKVYVGRFRPCFYEMCGFDKSTRQCEGDPLLVINAQRSFPSGHSSLAFCSMTTLCLFFLGKVGLRKGVKAVAPQYPSLGKKIASLLALSPMLLAFFIAASRVHDFRHHPSDVIAGALIGTTCAVFAHGLWYPSIYSVQAGYPLHTLYRMTLEYMDDNKSVDKEEEKAMLEIAVGSY